MPSVDSALSLMNRSQVSNSHRQPVHSECNSIFLLLWMWEPFTQLCTYSQGQQLHVSFTQRTVFASIVSSQEKRRHFLQLQWAQIHSIQTALGAQDVRHAYQVVPGPKIKHNSIFTKATKTTNEISDTWIFKIFNSRFFHSHSFSICWKTPSLGTRCVLWLLSSQCHAIS